jgi:hypothetical protein
LFSGLKAQFHVIVVLCSQDIILVRSQQLNLAEPEQLSHSYGVEHIKRRRHAILEHKEPHE